MQTGALKLRPNRNFENAVYAASVFAIIRIRKTVGIRNRKPMKRSSIVSPAAAIPPEKATGSWSSSR
jgi:hypothetical protein